MTVDGNASIGNCISSLVDHLGFPKRDGLGRVLTYSLRPLSGGHPLPNTLRFADARLLPETRLVLEVDDANAITQPVSISITEGSSARPPIAEPPMNPSRHMMNRRTFVVGSVLAGGAVSGLLTRVATAFATQQRTLPPCCGIREDRDALECTDVKTDASRKKKSEENLLKHLYGPLE